MNRVPPGPGASAATAPRERNILVVTSATHFLVHLYMLVYPSVALALQTDFDLPLAMVLALSFWMYLLYGVGALPAGMLTDWLGWRPMLVLCLFGTGGCAMWAAASGSPASLRLALAGLGLFASIYHPTGMSLISRGVRRRGWALGVNGVFGNLGVVSAPFLAGLLTATVGWRRTYLFLALPALLVGLLTLWLRVDGEVAQGSSLPDPTRRRRLYYFGLLGVAMALAGVVYRGQTLILPAFFSERIQFLDQVLGRLNWWPNLGTKTVAATFLTSVAYLAGILGMMVGGSLADRRDLRRLYLIFHGLSVPLLFLLAYLSNLPLLLCALGYSFFAFGMQPVENSLVAVLTPARLRSTAYGLKFILTFGLGSVAVYLVGHWEEQGGLAAVFPQLALFLVVLVFFAAWLWFATRREPAATFCSLSGKRQRE